VLIVSDDQGYNDLGVLSDHILTPNLDRLAREGVRLTNFYVAWPACTPSRGAFLTGRYPQRNGIYDMIRNEAPDYGHQYTPEEYAVTWERIGGMDTREILLPQMLQQAGYYSGIFGKWDLGMHRRFLPLASAAGTNSTGSSTRASTTTRTSATVCRRCIATTSRRSRIGAPTAPTCSGARRFAFVRANRDRPFFLYLPFNAPHNASNLDPAIRAAPRRPSSGAEMYPELFAQEGLVEAKRYGQPARSPTRHCAPRTTAVR
jgi:arylsulfatase A